MLKIMYATLQIDCEIWSDEEKGISVVRPTGTESADEV